jgi:hypothetical protein
LGKQDLRVLVEGTAEKGNSILQIWYNILLKKLEFLGDEINFSCMGCVSMELKFVLKRQ